MSGLANISPRTVALIVLAWILTIVALPRVITAAADVYLWIETQRHPQPGVSRDFRASWVSLRALFATLFLPPIALVVIWWIARRT